MTNTELARLLRSAASALEHGRKVSATIKLHNIMAELHSQFDGDSNCEDEDSRNALGVLIHAGERVVNNWESGDLAGAVNDLADVIEEAKHPDTDWHRAGCVQCQYIYDCGLPNPGE